MLAEKSPRAEDLSEKLHKLFAEHQGDGATEKLENIKVLVTYLAAQAGGYNSCCVAGNFDKDSPILLRPDQVRSIVDISRDLTLAIESVVASALLDSALPYSEEWFQTLITPASNLGYASAKTNGYVGDYVEGLINNLGAVIGSEASCNSNPEQLSEEVIDSFTSDLKDSIAGVVALCQDKWSKFFADKAAAQGQKKGRS